MKRLIFICILFLSVVKTEASFYLSMQESDRNFFTKESVRRTLFVCNDVLENKEIIVQWNTSVFSAVIQEGKEKMKLGELEGIPLKLTLEMPEVKRRAPITLKVQIVCDGKVEVERQWDYSVFPQNISEPLKSILKNKEIGIFDSSGKMKKILSGLEIPFTPLSNQLNVGAFKGDLIIIGPEEISRDLEGILLILEDKVHEGVSVVSFQEEFDIEDQFLVPLNNIAIRPLEIKNITILSQNHPIFSGLTEDDFSNWREDEVVTRFPLIKPVKGNFRILAEGDLSTAVLLEVILGKGRFVFCQLPVINKFQGEPIAQVLFANLLRYAFIEQKPLQPVVIYGTQEAKTMKVLNSLNVAKDTTGKSDFIIVCIDENSKESIEKLKKRAASHISEVTKNDGAILLFASFPEAVDFLAIKEKIKAMNIAPEGQQKIYYRHEEIIILGRENPLLWGMNEDEIELLMRKGKMFKFQSNNSDIVVCQSLFDDDDMNLRIISQLLTNLGMRIEKEVASEETDLKQ